MLVDEHMVKVDATAVLRPRPEVEFRAMTCRIRDAGAIPAASTTCVINHLIAMVCANGGRGQVSRRLRFSPGFRTDGGWRNAFLRNGFAAIHLFGLHFVISGPWGA